MTRRARCFSYDTGIDLSGLDKRQQRRAMRRFGRATPEQRLLWSIFGRHIA